MSNISFSLIDAEKLETILTKIDLVFEILNDYKLQPDKLYTNKEACNYLNVCSKTLQNYRDNGQIKFIQSGRKINYTKLDLDTFLTNNRKELFKKEIFKL